MADSPKSTHTAFFYGTLMAPPVLYRVIYGTSRPSTNLQSRTTFRSALLSGYRRHRVAGCDYPAMFPCPGSSVRGSLVTGLMARDLLRLDIFEGSQYARQEVNVKVLQGVDLDESTVAAAVGGAAEVQEEVRTETYVWKEEYRADLEDGEWDFEGFKKEKMRFWMGEKDMSYLDQTDSGVEVDEGFADVDRAVAEEEASASKNRQPKERKDPMGGRGVNGDIGRQLNQVGL